MLKERVDSKASAGCPRKQVSPTYLSQTCPVCVYLHRDYRRGDTFQCQQCRHTGDSDQVVATKHKATVNDQDTRLFRPKARSRRFCWPNITPVCRKVPPQWRKSVSRPV
ncbi:MAG: transposase [Anaerolineae bacterium]|nr:transposase [Anaerolineae bacterium]